jgi:hypothetical protein
MPEPQQPIRDPREMIPWVRRYAENRAAPFILSMLVFVGLSLAISGGSWLAGWAYMTGNAVLLGGCIAFLILTLVVLAWFSMPRWGGKWLAEYASRAYAEEGRVALPCSSARPRRGLLWGLGLGFGACIIASVVLGMLGYIPDRYMQPVSAIYFVPFVTMLGILTRPGGSPLMFLWPVLYGLHAALIVAGAPIVFTGPWSGLDMLIPVAGYGLLAGLAAHFYSRFALRKLRRLAQTQLPHVEEA